MIDTGGSAFPSKDDGNRHHPGMTLRAWLAGQALMGILCGGIGVTSPENKSFSMDRLLVSACSYQYADAMLKARKETKK